MHHQFRHLKAVPGLAAVAMILTGILWGGMGTMIRGQTAPAPPAKAAPAAAAIADDWRKIVTPPLHSFVPQKPKRVELPNGMILLLQEDRELPLINGFARIRGGAVEEPAEKIGLVSLLGETWRTGGTKKRDGDQLDDFLEAHAAKVETRGESDWVSLQFSCLKEDFEDTFSVFQELLSEPEFREEKLDLAKQQARTNISRRNDESSEIAQREARKLTYGPDHPLARQPEYWTVAAVTREDLMAWHREHVFPNRMILGIVGDFNAGEMETKVKKAFESWAAGPAYSKTKLAFPPTEAGVHLISKEDITQSSIFMVQLGTTKLNPDFFSLTVMNEIFGGGFSSRLFSNIRSKKGFAYEVGGAVGMDWDYPGQYLLFMGTQSEKTTQAIDAFYAEIEGMSKTPVSAEELKRAKDSLLNSFIFKYESKSAILADQINLEFYGYPADFNERFPAGIEKITAADVTEATKKYLKKDGFAILVVGNPRKFDRPLSSFGKVEMLDISIPTERTSAPKREAAGTPGSPAAAEEGKALVTKVAEAMGGLEKLRSIEGARIKIVQMVKGPQGEFQVETESVIQFPDRRYVKAKTPMGEMTTVVTADRAFMVIGGQTRDFPASTKETMSKESFRDTVFLLKNITHPKFSFTLAGKEKVGDTETMVVDVNAEGTKTRWLVDPTSLRILRASFQGTGMTGPSNRVLEFSDWKSFHGIILPTRYTATENGKDAGWTEIQEVEFNPKIDPKIYEKP